MSDRKIIEFERAPMSSQLLARAMDTNPESIVLIYPLGDEENTVRVAFTAHDDRSQLLGYLLGAAIDLWTYEKLEVREL